jgi:transcriptional regulator
MYNPSDFKKDDPSKLFDFIEKNSFGILVSQKEGKLEASHLPVLAQPDFGEQGGLLSHMAKANPQWNSLAGQEVMMIFQGPHAYISPSWYGTLESVPTWNYVSVHAYGRFIPIMDEGEVSEILHQMVGFYEGALPRPWDMGKLPEDYFKKLLKMVVGFRIEISRLEGKWKLGQNHKVEKRERVVRALEQGGYHSKEVAKLMKEEMK